MSSTIVAKLIVAASLVVSPAAASATETAAAAQPAASAPAAKARGGRQENLQAASVEQLAPSAARLPDREAVEAGRRRQPVRNSRAPAVPSAAGASNRRNFCPARVLALPTRRSAMAYKIAIIVGSLREGSINRKVARSICGLRRRQSRLLDDRDRRPAALQPGSRLQSARAMGAVPAAGRRGRRRAVLQPRI